MTPYLAFRHDTLPARVAHAVSGRTRKEESTTLCGVHSRAEWRVQLMLKVLTGKNWIHHEDVGSFTVGAAAQGSVIREYISMYIYTADNILLLSE